MCGLNASIILSFMVVGHTKFTPDSCFGLFKQRFRRTNVQCLSDIATCVEQSATVNKVKIAGTEAGEVNVPSYNWLSFFAPQFKKVPRIKQYHQFQITSTHPGVVVCKDFSDSPGTAITILKQPWTPKSTELPPIVTPSGLSPEREWYLFDKIRPFCERRCHMSYAIRAQTKNSLYYSYTQPSFISCCQASTPMH